MLYSFFLVLVTALTAHNWSFHLSLSITSPNNYNQKQTEQLLNSVNASGQAGPVLCLSSSS